MEASILIIQEITKNYRDKRPKNW